MYLQFLDVQIKIFNDRLRGHASMWTGKRLLGGGGWRWVEARSGRVFSYLISDPRRGKLGIFGSRGGRP